MFPLHLLAGQRWYDVGLMQALLVGKGEFLWVGFEFVGWFGGDQSYSCCWKLGYSLCMQSPWTFFVLGRRSVLSITGLIVVLRFSGPFGYELNFEDENIEKT
ncbi:hypothetical protein L1987_72665 [Smallanthus sonchifolius]|uniref:Uncharacterized protein n=1 Tax=Smallanthus sonchifolius TaxID=185202 RepID=A0ACB9AWR1_9ASTR|nr:hypothetical protein L1987_72665 [Smallanthus sonchifolius]